MNGIVAALASIAAVASLWGLKAFVEKIATSSVEKALDKHRNELAKELRNFDLFSAKKHEAYARAYRLILIAEGAIAKPISSGLAIDYSTYSKEDVGITLDDIEKRANVRFGQPTRMKLQSLWGTDRAAGVRELTAAIRQAEATFANHQFVVANNYVLQTRLYQSDAVASASDELLTVLWQALLPLLVPGMATGMEQHELKNKAAEIRRRLEQLMRRELQIGSYSSTRELMASPKPTVGQTE